MEQRLFSEKHIQNLFEEILASIKTRINKESEDYILNVGESQYEEYLKNEFKVEGIVLRTDEIFIDSEEIEAPGKIFPDSWDVEPDELYKVDCILYHVPFEGNSKLLSFTPSRNSPTGHKSTVDYQKHLIKFKLFNFNYPAEKIKEIFLALQRSLDETIANLNIDLERFNNSLNWIIQNEFQQRKTAILNQQNFLLSIGIPVKKKEDVSNTFSIPNPKLKEQITIRPQVAINGYKPEPTLEDLDYQKILKLINDVGKNFERLPSVYTEKHEEDLRDHILFVLDPNFQGGSASGETFNKKGKTDIQLRYDSSVVFISECKFWGGKKKYLETIDQLLSYLTWRDSKTSIVIFVRNKEMVPIINIVSKATKEHKKFIKELPKSDESWFNYIFCLPDDSNKEIKLAVQLYHIP